MQVFRKHNRNIQRQTPRGYALIELPLVLCILMFLGLAGVFVFDRYGSAVSWYAWPLGAVGPPVALIFFALWSDRVEQRKLRESRNNDDVDAA